MNTTYFKIINWIGKVAVDYNKQHSHKPIRRTRIATNVEKQKKQKLQRLKKIESMKHSQDSLIKNCHIKYIACDSFIKKLQQRFFKKAIINWILIFSSCAAILWSFWMALPFLISLSWFISMWAFKTWNIHGLRTSAAQYHALMEKLQYNKDGWAPQADQQLKLDEAVKSKIEIDLKCLIPKDIEDAATIMVESESISMDEILHNHPASVFHQQENNSINETDLIEEEFEEENKKYLRG